MPVPVGFVGLGLMGSAMSAHLLRAGHEVIGCDLDAARLREHEERGGVAVDSPAEAAARAGVVITSLPSVRALADVVHGPDGLAARPSDGLVVVETSTLPVQAKEDARGRLERRGVRLLDAPLSGTAEQARHRDLVAYVSGDDDAKARALPVLDAMTRACHDVGPFGNGTAMKIVANLLVAVHNLAAAEALLLAEHAGLDAATVLRAIGDGAGTSRMFEVRGPLMAAGAYGEPTMRTGLFEKDLQIIDAFAAKMRVPTPLFSAASAYYRAALAQGRGDEDTACVHAVLAGLAPELTPDLPPEKETK
ncbi:MAG TPA: NAD(P)-dependent oxidoreductase [Streptosporangiaceae bacterium]|jgi:3-hydroxyisobutyrate dehydrogenase-like beta-hydroxyacid dehydrogenase